MLFGKKRSASIGSVLMLALAVSAPACMGFDVGPAGEEELAGYDEHEQELLRRDIAFDPPDEVFPGVSGPDLVGEILYCNADTIAFAIRNQGNVATDAQACGIFGCWPSIKTWVYTGDGQHTVWNGNLGPGEENIVTFEKPHGMEGFLAWIYVDVWGCCVGDGSVTETNENNNYTSGYCVY